MNNLDKLKETIKDFFMKNKSLVYLLPLLVIMLIVVIILYSGGDKPPAPSASTTQNQAENQTSKNISDTQSKNNEISSSNKVEVLPQIERTADSENKNENLNTEKNKNESNPVNPFDLPMKVSGVLVGSEGGSVAIIETSQSTYVVKEGELINNTWRVSKIEEKGVLLLNGEKETYVTLSN